LIDRKAGIPLDAGFFIASKIKEKADNAAGL
jgi:hypothetical protein